MLKISTISFGMLKNAEHVSLFANAKVAVDKIGITSLGITEAQYEPYLTALDVEQDIVNRSMASIYTPEMEAMDKERDRLFRLIRIKLQSVLLESAHSDSAKYATMIERYLLAKYGGDVCLLPYQEESAVIAGFILDVNKYLGDEGIEDINIERELASLESANTKFADQYNERVTEKAGTDADQTRKFRLDTEEQFRLLCLHLEFMANSDTTSVGKCCASLVGIINEIINDAQHRLNVRLGKTEETPDNSGVVPPVFNK